MRAVYNTPYEAFPLLCSWQLCSNCQILTASKPKRTKTPFTICMPTQTFANGASGADRQRKITKNNLYHEQKVWKQIRKESWTLKKENLLTLYHTTGQHKKGNAWLEKIRKGEGKKYRFRENNKKQQNSPPDPSQSSTCFWGVLCYDTLVTDLGKA